MIFLLFACTLSEKDTSYDHQSTVSVSGKVVELFGAVGIDAGLLTTSPLRIITAAILCRWPSFFTPMPRRCSKMRCFKTTSSHGSGGSTTPLQRRLASDQRRRSCHWSAARVKQPYHQRNHRRWRRSLFWAVPALELARYSLFWHTYVLLLGIGCSSAKVRYWYW